ncbi:MAG: YciI family protein [Micropepsaceae bacterium]
MPNFIFAYHGSKRPENPAQYMARWRAWVESLGEALVNPVMPVGKSKTVGRDGVADDGGSNPISGITVVKVDNMDAAIALAKRCPHLDLGTIEVAPVMEM